MQVWSKSIDWFRNEHTEPIFWTFQSAGVTLKLGQGQQNQISSSPSPNNVSLQVWSNPSTSSEDNAWKPYFGHFKVPL